MSISDLMYFRNHTDGVILECMSWLSLMRTQILKYIIINKGTSLGVLRLGPLNSPPNAQDV